ncbi:MAG TPA: alpha/beta hydrolase-fold protein, partial [Armatimonadaceae bacterium]|nr:alpha/beta hydrolase-fold protein [Armatimonadaceae bacterium]
AAALLSALLGAGMSSAADAAYPAAPQQGQRREVRWNNPDGPAIPGVEHGVLRSPSMDREVGYNVYLPPGYKDGKDRYPVVYFLHGAGGNENSDAGGFSALVRKQIEAKAIPPVICVFPNGGMSGYADRPEQKVMGETLIVRELIPHIDAKYRTVAAREGRAVCGFSMGGGGAIRLALKYPDLFAAAGSWAGALGARRGGPTGSPATLVKENADKVRGRVRLLLVVGDKDMTYGGHPALVAALKDSKIAHEYEVLPGVGHDLGAYHQKTGERMVRFVAAGFPRKPGE